MKNHVHQLIEEAISKLKDLQQNESALGFKDVPPVLWFGNIESSNPKVLVVSANPNNPELPKDKPRIPSAKGWSLEKVNIASLENDYNRYFQQKNPATNWFGVNPADEGRKEDRQGRIEDFLNGLDASFYDGEMKYQAIHIDLLPFATEKSFSSIADSIMQKESIIVWIDRHIREMVELIQPQLIVVNGINNFRYFNWCVNMEAQPYRMYKHGGSTIWKSIARPNKPTIIGISTNMGDCRKKCNELKEIGEYVKTNILTLCDVTQKIFC